MRQPTVRHRHRLMTIAVLAATIMTGSCSDMGHPRDDEITATIDDFWDAVRVRSDDVHTSPYARETKRDIVACQDLDEDDRWIALRSSQVPGERYEQEQIWERANVHLEERGFDISRYRWPLSGGLGLRAVNDELAVYVDVDSNGYTHLEVVSGPCATRMGEELPEATEPID